MYTFTLFSFFFRTFSWPSSLSVISRQEGKWSRRKKGRTKSTHLVHHQSVQDSFGVKTEGKEPCCSCSVLFTAFYKVVVLTLLELTFNNVIQCVVHSTSTWQNHPEDLFLNVKELHAFSKLFFLNFFRLSQTQIALLTFLYETIFYRLQHCFRHHRQQDCMRWWASLLLQL